MTKRPAPPEPYADPQSPEHRALVAAGAVVTRLFGTRCWVIPGGGTLVEKEALLWLARQPQPQGDVDA